MHLLKYTAATLMVIATSVADAVPAYLTGSNLKNAIANQTLIGKDWAEFYQTDGKIVGKARVLFVTYNYYGQWTAFNDHICYHYPPQQGQSAKDTCSKLTLNGSTITFYELSGQPKQKDGVAQRKPGNTLSQFR